MAALILVVFLVRRSKDSSANDAPQAAAPPVEAGPAPPPLPEPGSPVSTAAQPTQPPSTPSDEVSLMGRLRGIEDTDPVQALELAREGNRRFPDGVDAAERAAIVVKSLARTGHLSEARGEAEAMVNRYSGTRWALEVEQQTGAHPRVNH